MQTGGQKGREISYHLGLNEEMGGLVCTERRISTKVACERGVPLLATKSLEGSNQTVQHTDAQVTLS